MEINIRSTRFIKPSKSTPESQRNFKLSLLDQLAPCSYINPIFYYKTSGHEVDILNTCDHLANSLSEALNLYYPLAGRLTDDGLEVYCNDQGVQYLVTQVTTTLDHFLKLGPKIDHINQRIRAKGQTTNSLLTVQVNLFNCGALVIGVIASHQVIDGYNLIRFINQWASMNRTGAANGPFLPTFDKLDSVFPPKKNVSLKNKNASFPVDPEAVIVTKRFVFSGTTISKLRSKAGSVHGEHTRVTLVASLIWKALISVDQMKTGRLRDCLLAPAMNLRGKASSPVSKSSFGNVWAPYPIWFLQTGKEPEFVDLVGLVEDATRTMVMWVQKASGEEICSHAKAVYGSVCEELKQNKFCIFTSWCRFGVYDVDFGWGRPCCVGNAGSSLEMVTLMDDKDGDGIEAWVSLNHKEMHGFEQDHDIVGFTTGSPPALGS